MAIIQKLQGEGLTFEDLSVTVLKKVLAYNTYKQIDVVFEMYVDTFIKEIKRSRGGNEGMTFQNITSQHKIVNWRRFLRSSECKNTLTKYLVESWREEKMKSYFSGSKVLFVTYGVQCFKVSWCGVEDIFELHCNREVGYFKSNVCVSGDTDVMILCTYVCKRKGKFSSQVLLKTIFLSVD